MGARPQQGKERVTYNGLVGGETLRSGQQKTATHPGGLVVLFSPQNGGAFGVYQKIYGVRRQVGHMGGPTSNMMGSSLQDRVGV